MRPHGGWSTDTSAHGRFNDRPSRAGGSDPTQTWLNGIGATKSNPVNAALVVDVETKSTKSVGKQVGDRVAPGPPPAPRPPPTSPVPPSPIPYMRTAQPIARWA